MMFKLQLILLFICAQIFLMNCYTLNHFPRPFWPELESESNDDLMKILHTESFLNEVNPSTDVTLFDQTDGHPRGLQKRGRQCLWKVCSWALDKRSLRSSSNSVDALSKLLY